MTMGMQSNGEARVPYEGHPLVQSMLQNQKRRTSSLEDEGKCQIKYPKSSDGWFRTICIVRGRALDWMVLPWCVIVLHATVYTIFHEVVLDVEERDMASWEIFFSFVLNSTLAFLLVFRLNRAASRFWAARKYWGDIVAQTRSFVSGIIVHGDHDRQSRDEAIRWLAAFSLSTMDLLRGEHQPRLDNYAGILCDQQVQRLREQVHPPMYAADQVRHYLKQLFHGTYEREAQMAFTRGQEMNALEQQLNTMIWCGGGMERIKSTPLPIVYVSHLRTFLLINLLLFPWVFGPSWGWMTIPIVAASAFAWLGIDSAAVEVECPFRRDRVNALNMDAYVIGLLSTIQQQIKNHADRVIETEARC